ncbi:hypothetical protein BGZ83_011245 [Gryganskiella cystojenkinii]|nr:hypothetical protein BGZ83_011245 [Gryganskiella cystojenkinii]
MTALPEWTVPSSSSETVEGISSSTSLALSDYTLSSPSHPLLLAVYHELQPPLKSTGSTSTVNTAADQVSKICKDHTTELCANDFNFILETIRECSISRQKFWESIVTLIRCSIPSSSGIIRSGRSTASTQVNGKDIFVPSTWTESLADTLDGAFWAQGSYAFAKQVEHLWDQEYLARTERYPIYTSTASPSVLLESVAAPPSAHDSTPQENELWMEARRMNPLDAEVLVHAMVDSLLLRQHDRRALIIYDVFSERGYVMPSRLLANLVQAAVDGRDATQLERIGIMLLKSEAVYTESMSPSSSSTSLAPSSPSASVSTTTATSSGDISTVKEGRIVNRPLLMRAKLMDSFIYGASKAELYDLARAVFKRGLENGQRYRASTYTGILNSYSVKEFGFDIVSAAEASKRSERNGGGRRQGRLSRHLSDHLISSAENSTPSSSSAKNMTPADPVEIEMYVYSMEQNGVKPSSETLNVLVKLYLEMALYKVQGAPSWNSAFRRYNPLRLSPDLVTNNTLLAYYEKYKDLETMRRIYNEMGWKPPQDSTRGERKSRKPKVAVDGSTAEGGVWDEFSSIPRYNLQSPPLMQEPQEATESLPQEAERPPGARSNRDVFTYNIMLHALLRHAVDTKDLDAIGQCFHDMELDGIQSDTVTFNTNILYHIMRGDLIAAQQVFKTMDQSRHNDDLLSSDSRRRRRSRPIRSIPSSVNCRSSRGSSSSEPQESELEGQRQSEDSRSPPLDVVTLTTLVSGFGRAKQMDKAGDLFKDMTNRYGIEPNLKTYSALVAGLHHVGEHKRAVSVWETVLQETENAMKAGDLNGSPLTEMERCQVEARRQRFRDQHNSTIDKNKT